MQRGFSLERSPDVDETLQFSCPKCNKSQSFRAASCFSRGGLIDAHLQTMQERLIISCRFEGSQFYALVDIDLENEQYIISKTIPAFDLHGNHPISFEKVQKLGLGNSLPKHNLLEAIIFYLSSFVVNHENEAN